MWAYLSNERMTVYVEVQDWMIVKAPPIVQKFVGQPLDNLIRWMNKQEGFILTSESS